MKTTMMMISTKTTLIDRLLRPGIVAPNEEPGPLFRTNEIRRCFESLEKCQHAAKPVRFPHCAG